MRAMTGKRAETILELMNQIEYFTLARAWAALTDGEFFWEPFTTAWSIRRQDECRTPDPFGAGEWVADFEFPEPAPVPVTTIAWLYWHTGTRTLRSRQEAACALPARQAPRTRPRILSSARSTR